jgi:hypothetical protein
MATRRKKWSALTLALAMGGAARAQVPPTPPPSVPPDGEVIAIETLGADGVAPAGGSGQTIIAPDGSILPVPPLPPDCECIVEEGLITRCSRCLRDRIHNHWIGHPRFFAEPPFGASLYETMGRQKAKGDVHTFTLYRSDFLADSTQLSPGGARRLSFLASRLGNWRGPIVVEWTPETPEIGLGRREIVLAALNGASLGVAPERVLVGPSAFHGIMGPDAGNNHDALIYRDFSAPRAFSFSPTSTAEFGGGAR